MSLAGLLAIARAYHLPLEGFGWSLALKTAPAAEPLSLAETKRNRRVDGIDYDQDLTDLIVAARETAESMTGRQLMPATWLLRLDHFPFSRPLRIPRPPLATVASIKYVDTAGVEQTIDPAIYQVDVAGEPGRIEPAFSKCWPTARAQLNAVTVEFTAGYADAASVPFMIKRAMLLLVGHWFENREPLVAGSMVAMPYGVEAILLAHRVPMVL